MAIAPLVELVEFLVRNVGHDGIVDVPLPFSLAPRGCRHGHGSTRLLLASTWIMGLGELGVLGMIGLLENNEKFFVSCSTSS
ncbi:hypothetical protein M5D96_004303, partial [Drosophila gunungcola]